MSNGNDWQQQPGQQPGVGPQSAVRTYSSGSAAPEPEGMGLLTEGWGVGEPLRFDDISERIKLVWQRARGSVLKAFVALSLIGLALNLLAAISNILFYFIPAVGVVTSVLTLVLMFLLIPAFIFISMLQLAMFKPMHQLIFDDSNDTFGIMGVIKASLGVLLFTTLASLLLGLAGFLGTICCIVPGLLIGFLFCQTPYLVAARGMELGDAAKTSLRLNKAYWQVILGMVGAFIVAGVVITGISAAIGFVAGFISPFDGLVTSVVQWAFSLAITIGVFVVQMAVFSTIESKETGRMPVA